MITPKIAVKLLISSVIAGMLATMVGIGGGLIILPILLSFGVPALQVAATTGFIVMFSSCLSLLQSIFMRVVNYYRLLMFFTLSFAGSMIVTNIIDKIVQKT